jgi:hypothetical protein
MAINFCGEETIKFVRIGENAETVGLPHRVMLGAMIGDSTFEDLSPQVLQQRCKNLVIENNGDVDMGILYDCTKGRVAIIGMSLEMLYPPENIEIRKKIRERTLEVFAKAHPDNTFEIRDK